MVKEEQNSTSPNTLCAPCSSFIHCCLFTLFFMYLMIFSISSSGYMSLKDEVSNESLRIKKEMVMA
jgi:hypothetical protein